MRRGIPCETCGAATPVHLARDDRRRDKLRQRRQRIRRPLRDQLPRSPPLARRRNRRALSGPSRIARGGQAPPSLRRLQPRADGRTAWPMEPEGRQWAATVPHSRCTLPSSRSMVGSGQRAVTLRRCIHRLRTSWASSEPPCFLTIAGSPADRSRAPDSRAMIPVHPILLLDGCNGLLDPSLVTRTVTNAAACDRRCAAAGTTNYGGTFRWARTALQRTTPQQAARSMQRAAPDVGTPGYSEYPVGVLEY